ncbi:UNKNOWN [Stylonychia lemnae]|uniref:Uncharacterized protein n=1 Tax=Stylonychia lemnae TaxID=5949 RepID=A0A078B5P9_STYLE|nr:UNKNOWN [Stylonychia lemnae]|eukprot:CDW88632.1 UNKNOWN [Stylonychia lemnae]
MSDIKQMQAIKPEIIRAKLLSPNTKKDIEAKKQQSSYLENIVSKRLDQGYQRLSQKNSPIKINRDLIAVACNDKSDLNENKFKQFPGKKNNPHAYQSTDFPKTNSPTHKKDINAKGCSVDDILHLLQSKYIENPIKTNAVPSSLKERLILHKQEFKSQDMLEQSSELQRTKRKLYNKRRMTISKSIQNLKELQKRSEDKIFGASAVQNLQESIDRSIIVDHKFTTAAINYGSMTFRDKQFFESKKDSIGIELPPIINQNIYGTLTQRYQQYEKDLEEQGRIRNLYSNDETFNYDSDLQIQPNSNVQSQILDDQIFQNELINEDLPKAKAQLLRNKGLIDSESLHVLDLYRIKGQSFVPTTDTEIGFFKKSLNKIPIPKRQVDKSGRQIKVQQQQNLQKIFKVSKIDQKYEEFQEQLSKNREKYNLQQNSIINIKICERYSSQQELHTNEDEQLEEEQSFLRLDDKHWKKNGNHLSPKQNSSFKKQLKRKNFKLLIKHRPTNYEDIKYESNQLQKMLVVSSSLPLLPTYKTNYNMQEL